MTRRRPIELRKTVLGAGGRRSPWHPDGSAWALVEFLGSATDTLVDDPFFFVEDRRPAVVGRSETRGEDCDLRLRDPSISRQHCELFRERGSWWIRDLGSTNGTKVDARPVGAEPVRLVDEGCIEVGDARLRFRHAEGASNAIVRMWCECKDGTMLNESVLAQACSRAARREAPAHLALFAVRDTQYVRSAMEGEQEALVNALRAVAEATSPESVFVAQIAQPAPSIAVLLRGTQLSAARELIGLWHAYVLREQPDLAANCALVTLRGPDDDPLRRAKAKLVACELAGNGVVNDEDVDVEWFREDVRRIRQTVEHGPFRSNPHRWFAVGGLTNGSSPASEREVRRDLARGIMTLPAGSRVSIAWQAPAGLWFLAVDSEQEPLSRLLGNVGALLFVHKERPESGWIDAVVAQLEARKPVDVTRMSTPVAQLLGATSPGKAERMMECARRFEAALRLLAAVSLAKLANDFTDAGGQVGQGYDPVLDTLARARTRAEGIGSYLWLLDKLIKASPKQSTIEPVRKLLASKWTERAWAACGGRNQAIHSGTEDLAKLIPRMEGVLRELAYGLVSPEFQLVDVVSVVPRRAGGGRVELVRLVGPLGHPPETLDRSDFTDPGTWLVTPDQHWVRLIPWVRWRECPRCGIWDLFVASVLLAHHDRPLRYHGTAHRHDYHEDLPDDDSVMELRALLMAVDRRGPPAPTFPGFD